METSIKSCGPKQTQRSNATSSASRCCAEHSLSSPATSPASSPPTESELCIKGRLNRNAVHAKPPRKTLDAFTCLEKGRASASENFKPYNTQRLSNPNLEDGARSNKKSRTDDQFVGGVLQAGPINDLLAGKRAEKSSINSDHNVQKNGDKGRLPATRLPHKKAFKTMRFLSEVRDCITVKSGHEPHPCGDSEGPLERRSPSRSLCLVEAGKHHQAEGTLADVSGTMHDFPFILPPAFKRARSSRDKWGHKKLVINETHLRDATVKVEKATGPGLLKVEAEIDRRACDSQEIVQKEVETDVCIKAADATAELPLTSVDIGNIEVEPATNPFSMAGERREIVGDAAERRGSPSLPQSNTDIAEYMDCSAPTELAACTHLSERLNQEAAASNDEEKLQRLSNGESEGGRACRQALYEKVQDILARDGASGEKAPAMARDMSEGKQWGASSAVDGGLPAAIASCNSLDEVFVGQEMPESITRRGTSKELRFTFVKNSPNIESKFMKGIFAVEKSEDADQMKRASRLQTHDGEDGTAHKLNGHVSQCLSQDRTKLGTFQLSLAPPGMLMAEAGYALNTNNSARMASAGRSQLPVQTHVQSEIQTVRKSQSQSQTHSDGYTASLSLSQSLHHNPSCSLNCFSGEHQELSCGGSRHLLQGNEIVWQRGWPTASTNEDDDGSFHSSQEKPKPGHVSLSGMYDCVANKMAPIISRASNLHVDDHLTMHGGVKLKGLPLRSFRQEKGAQRAAVAPREPWSQPLAPTSKKYITAHESRSGGGDENKCGGSFGLREIATEPIAPMAQRMQELPDSFLDSLRDLARDFLRDFEKRGDFLILQSLINNRTDLTENNLLHAHHRQLEILVALKTGEQAFVEVGAKPLTYKVLTEIFLQTRCRNVACQQSLPVDGCECEVCSQKSSFCHECMCVVCSKFDSENQTFRWLGCDFCMHWCHADCGLRMLHIAPAQSSKGESEMQYRCVACGHNTELFGFVKNAFQLFAENWGAETLAEELDCVRRIFHGSKDARGQQLCRKVEVMLKELDMKVNAAEVCSSMLQYLNEANLDGGKMRKPADNASTMLTQFSKPSEGKAMAIQEAAAQDERKTIQPLKMEFKNEVAAELRAGPGCKKAEIDDIQSMVTLKQAEAKMLQLRADEAHQQARGLQQIIHVKQDKIEGDYMSKYAKLKLNEAEEERSKRFLELQVLERAHLEYQSMKLRMEAQIRDLTMKVGMVNWQFA